MIKIFICRDTDCIILTCVVVSNISTITIYIPNLAIYGSNKDDCCCERYFKKFLPK